MSPGSTTAPPCGAIASPQTVTISEGARGGAWAIRRAIQRRMCGSGAGARSGVVREAVMIGGRPRSLVSRQDVIQNLR